MQAIYKPRGKALEYAELAVNLYNGCPHGCRYCYVPGIKKISRAEHQKKVFPREGILDALEKDAKKIQGDPRHVLMCFTCDPYPWWDWKPYPLTREAINILKTYSLRVMVLTKGGERAVRDFDLLTSEDKFGCTLTFLDPRDSRDWEPRAELPATRIAALQEAHQKGIQTWASLEPVIDPQQTIDIIELTHDIVDEFKVGKLNYMESNFKLKPFALRLAETLNKWGCNYYIKNSLIRYWPEDYPRSVSVIKQI